MASQQTAILGADLKPEERKALLIKRYEDQIKYYWDSSRRNKRAYKVSRYLIIVLGAAVTWATSIASADFVKEAGLSLAFAVVTPILAATLAITSGFSQSFQWGATWSETVLTAEQLAKERDRLSVTPAAEINAAAELDTLNDLVTAESRKFFERILGSQKPGTSS